MNSIWKLVVRPISRIIKFCLKILFVCVKEILLFFIPSDLIALSILRDFERFILAIPSKIKSVFSSFLNFLHSNTSKEWIKEFKTGSNRALVIVVSLCLINIIIFAYYANSYLKHSQTLIEIPVYLHYPHPHLLSIHSQKLLISTETIQSVISSSPEVQYFYPYAYIPLDSLASKPKPGEFYDVLISLDLPESSTNRQLGMFMVNVSLLSENLSMIKNEERPFLLSYKSSLFRYLKLFLLFPFYLFGFLTERQVILQTIMENFQDIILNPLKIILITISTHQIEVYKVNIYFSLKPRGLDNFTINWPISSTFIFIAMLGTIFALICLIIFLVAAFFTLDIVDKNLIRSETNNQTAFQPNTEVTVPTLVTPVRYTVNSASNTEPGLLD